MGSNLTPRSLLRYKIEAAFWGLSCDKIFIISFPYFRVCIIDLSGLVKQELPLFVLKYSHTSFYELPLYETSELRNRFLEVTASTKNQQIL